MAPLSRMVTGMKKKVCKFGKSTQLRFAALVQEGISSKAKLQRAKALPAKLDNIKTTTVVSESTVIDQDTTKVTSSKEPKTQKSANSKGQMLLQALKNKTDEVKQLELLLSYRGDQVATYKNMMSKALDVLQDSVGPLHPTALEVLLMLFGDVYRRPYASDFTFRPMTAPFDIRTINDDNLMLCDSLKGLGCITKGDNNAPAAPSFKVHTAVRAESSSESKVIAEGTCAAKEAGKGIDLSEGNSSKVNETASSMPSNKIPTKTETAAKTSTKTVSKTPTGLPTKSKSTAAPKPSKPDHKLPKAPGSKRATKHNAKVPAKTKETANSEDESETSPSDCSNDPNSEVHAKMATLFGPGKTLPLSGSYMRKNSSAIERPFLHLSLRKHRYNDDSLVKIGCAKLKRVGGSSDKGKDSKSEAPAAPACNVAAKGITTVGGNNSKAENTASVNTVVNKSSESKRSNISARAAPVDLAAIHDDDLMMFDCLKGLGCSPKGNIAPAAPAFNSVAPKFESPVMIDNPCFESKSNETRTGGDMSFLTQCKPFDLWAMDDDLLSGILPASGSNEAVIESSVPEYVPSMPRMPPCPKYLTKTECIAPKSEPKTDMSFLTQCTPFDLWAMDDDLLSGILPASGSNKAVIESSVPMYLSQTESALKTEPKEEFKAPETASTNTGSESETKAGKDSEKSCGSPEGSRRSSTGDETVVILTVDISKAPAAKSAKPAKSFESVKSVKSARKAMAKASASLKAAAQALVSAAKEPRCSAASGDGISALLLWPLACACMV